MYILPKSTVKLRYLRNVYGPIGQVLDYITAVNFLHPTYHCTDCSIFSTLTLSLHYTPNTYLIIALSSLHIPYHHSKFPHPPYHCTKCPSDLRPVSADKCVCVDEVSVEVIHLPMYGCTHSVPHNLPQHHHRHQLG